MDRPPAVSAGRLATLCLGCRIGSFAAGMMIGLATRDEGGQPLREKIEAVCYGFFVPFFFVLSGMTFALGALLGSVTSMLLVPLFLGSS